MKKIIISVAVGLCAVTAHTQESNVILDYNSITLGYAQQIDIYDSKDAHGAGLLGSLRTGNIVVSGGLGYYSLEDYDIDQFEIGGGIGYVYEVEERLHLVPSISLKYVDNDIEEHWLAVPAVAANFAISDKWGGSVSVGYGEPFDTDYDSPGAWAVGIGTTFEIAENIGFGLTTLFLEGRGYSSFAIGLGYHF
jgi:hypothetical protein